MSSHKEVKKLEKSTRYGIPVKKIKKYHKKYKQEVSLVQRIEQYD